MNDHDRIFLVIKINLKKKQIWKNWNSATSIVMQGKLFTPFIGIISC